jgi:SAM-dependent methyltransferase
MTIALQMSAIQRRSICAMLAGAVFIGNTALAQHMSLEDRYLNRAAVPLVLPGPQDQGEITENTLQARLSREFISAFVLLPTVEDVTQRQFYAVNLLRKLKDPRAFDILLPVSRSYGRLMSPFSEAVGESARAALVDLLPFFSPQQRLRVLTSLKETRTALQAFVSRRNGEPDPWGEEDLGVINAVILRAQGEVDRLGNTPASQERANLNLLSYREAGGAFVEFPWQVFTSLIRLILDDPVKAPTRMAWGILSSATSGIIAFLPVTLPGLVTGGEYGGFGSDLGQNVANTVCWFGPVRNAARRLDVALRECRPSVDWGNGVSPPGPVRAALGRAARGSAKTAGHPVFFFVTFFEYMGQGVVALRDVVVTSQIPREVPPEILNRVLGRIGSQNRFNAAAGDVIAVTARPPLYSFALLRLFDFNFKGKTILNLGSGNSRVTQMMNLLWGDSGTKAISLDLYARGPEPRIASNFVRGDALRLPIRSASQDLVMSTWFLEYFIGRDGRSPMRLKATQANLKILASEMIRVTKPGGQIRFSLGEGSLRPGSTMTAYFLDRFRRNSRVETAELHESFYAPYAKIVLKK